MNKIGKLFLFFLTAFSLTSCQTNNGNEKDNESSEKQEEANIEELKFVDIDTNNTKVIDGIRHISLSFDKVISKDTDLVELEKTKVANFIKLDRKFISDISGASISCKKDSKNLLITIPERISIANKTLLKISEGCVIGNSKLPAVRIVYDNGGWSNYKYFYITTNDSISITKKNKKYFLNVSNTISTGLENSINDKQFTCGTYFVKRSSYVSSDLSSLEEYFDKKAASSATYIDVPFTSTFNKNNSDYIFESSFEIDKTDVDTKYIPVGYLKYDNLVFLGQTGDIYSSLKEEASKNPSKYPELFLENCEFSISTSSSTEINKIDNQYGLKFANVIEMSEGYNLNNFTFECGTLLVDQIEFENSGKNNISSYISEHERDLIKVNSTDDVNIVNDVIQFSTFIPLNKESYNISYIPVGYLKVNNIVYYGQDGSYSCSLFNEAKQSIADYSDLFFDYYEIELNTEKVPQIKCTSGVYALLIDSELTIKNGNDLNDIDYESGTYLINKTHYNNSGLNSFESYLNLYTESYTSVISTYKKHVEQTKLTKNDDKYKITSSFDIFDDNYRTEFIAVSYIKIGTIYLYSQSPTNYDCVSLYGEAIKNPELYPDICTEYFTLSLLTTNTTYELLNNSFDKNLASLTYDMNGYYKITAHGNVNEVYIDGKLINNFVINSGEEYYISVANGQPKIIDAPHKTYLGFAEPNREVWRDTNCNNKLDSYTNNAIVFSEMNAECARIWINSAILYYGYNGAHPIYFDSGFSDVVNENAVREIQNTIAAYRNAGVKDIIMLVNGMYYSNDEYSVMHLDNDKSTPVVLNGHEQYQKINEILNNDLLTQERKNELINEFHMCQVYPTKNKETFLENNKKFYTMLSNLFDVDYFETNNEINLGPYSYDVGYYEKEYPRVFNNQGTEFVSAPIEDQYEIVERVTRNTADFCKAMTDGVLNSNRKNIRILTPAIAGVNDSLRDDNWGKPTLRDANRFIEEMYKYIVNEKQEKVSTYFQGVNMHPYIFHSYETGYNDCYLFWDPIKQNSTIKDANFNTDFANDWLNYITSIHNISVNYGDQYCSIYATEFGFTDYADSTASSWRGYTDAKYLPNVVNQMIPLFKSMSYLSGLYWFRLYSFDKGTTDGGEANFGFISKYQTLKKWGKDLYKQYTGNSSTTSFEQILKNLDNKEPVIDY